MSIIVKTVAHSVCGFFCRLGRNGIWHYNHCLCCCVGEISDNSLYGQVVSYLYFPLTYRTKQLIHLDSYKSQKEQRWYGIVYESPSGIFASQHTHINSQRCAFQPTQTLDWVTSCKKRASHANNLLIKRTFGVRDTHEYVLVAWRL